MKGVPFLWKVYESGTFSMEGIRKEYVFCGRYSKGVPFLWKVYERGTFSMEGIRKGYLFYGRYSKGVPFLWKVYERGTFSIKNGISKSKGLDLGAEPPRINFC